MSPDLTKPRDLSVPAEVLIDELRKLTGELSRLFGGEPDQAPLPVDLLQGDVSALVHKDLHAIGGRDAEAGPKLGIVNVVGVHEYILGITFEEGQPKSAALTQNGQAVWCKIYPSAPQVERA